MCKPGYESTDSGLTTNKNSGVDCDSKIYERCSGTQETDLYGNCKSSDDCKKECNGGSGKIQSGLGVCQCDSAVNVDDICNEACRAATKKVSYTSDGKL